MGARELLATQTRWRFGTSVLTSSELVVWQVPRNAYREALASFVDLYAKLS